VQRARKYHPFIESKNKIIKINIFDYFCTFFTIKTLIMKAIKFSESELEFLQTHYELELLDAENYVGEIKNILKKLGAIEQEITKEKPAKKAGKKSGRPKKQKKETKVSAEIPAPVVVKQDKKVAPKKTAAPKAAPKKVAPKKAVKKPAVKKAVKAPAAQTEPVKPV
jgi:hypothetical protein